MMQIRVDGAWNEIISGKVYVDGAWKDIVRGELRISSNWKALGTLTDPLTATAFPSILTGYQSGIGAVNAGSSTVTPTGGQGPFTYFWERLSGTAIISVTNSASANFSGTADSDETTSQFRCTVTDSLGATATAQVTVTIVLIGGENL